MIWPQGFVCKIQKRYHSLIHTLFIKLPCYQNHPNMKNNMNEMILMDISTYFSLFSANLTIDFKVLAPKFTTSTGSELCGNEFLQVTARTKLIGKEGYSSFLII